MKIFITGLLTQLTLAAPALAADLHPGEPVYRRICFVCHDRGSVLTAATGAPRLGNVRAWESRRGRGVEGLFTSITTQVPGKFVMPRIDLTDDELRLAIGYMLDASDPHRDPPTGMAGM
jgi:cytochrome c5